MQEEEESNDSESISFNSEDTAYRGVIGGPKPTMHLPLLFDFNEQRDATAAFAVNSYRQPEAVQWLPELADTHLAVASIQLDLTSSEHEAAVKALQEVLSSTPCSRPPIGLKLDYHAVLMELRGPRGFMPE
jgi:hypothetical protein